MKQELSLLQSLIGTESEYNYQLGVNDFQRWNPSNLNGSIQIQPSMIEINNLLATHEDNRLRSHDVGRQFCRGVVGTEYTELVRPEMLRVCDDPYDPNDCHYL